MLPKNDRAPEKNVWQYFYGQSMALRISCSSPRPPHGDCFDLVKIYEATSPGSKSALEAQRSKINNVVRSSWT